MSDFWIKVVMIIIVVHFIVGIGYLVLKLSPKKKDKDKKSD